MLDIEVTVAPESKDHPDETTLKYELLHPIHLCRKKRKRFFK